VGKNVGCMKKHSGETVSKGGKLQNHMRAHCARPVPRGGEKKKGVRDINRSQKKANGEEWGGEGFSLRKRDIVWEEGGGRTSKTAQESDHGSGRVQGLYFPYKALETSLRKGSRSRDTAAWLSRDRSQRRSHKKRKPPLTANRGKSTVGVEGGKKQRQSLGS